MIEGLGFGLWGLEDFPRGSKYSCRKSSSPKVAIWETLCTKYLLHIYIYMYNPKP